MPRSTASKMVWVGDKATVFFVGLLVMVVVFAFFGVLAAKPALADSFTVNSQIDREDLNPGDGICRTNAPPDTAICTLRAAIEETNAIPGSDAIDFNIGGSGVRTIVVSVGLGSLPAITSPVIIDGYTQPGSRKNTQEEGTNAVPLIELDGSDLIGAEEDPGLFIVASDTVVRGLVINRFPKGISIGGDGNRVEGNFIGADPSGTERLANDFGVFIEGGSHNVVGGTKPEARNLISGNGFGGVFIGSSTGNKVQGNLIGTKKSGSGDLGNRFFGVLIDGASKNIVGGISGLAANTIAFNGGSGVGVIGSTSTGNRILRNSIFSNGGPGIDLVGGIEDVAGRTSNDPGDSDTGPNNLQNKPAVTSASSATIKGRLSSKPNKTFVIRFFSNPSGEDEGKKFIGEKSVNTNLDGKISFTFTPEQEVALTNTVTSTATDAAGNTSEFSNAVKVLS